MQCSALAGAGTAWRQLPNDFPPGPAVYLQFRRWQSTLESQVNNRPWKWGKSRAYLPSHALQPCQVPCKGRGT